MDDRGNKMSVFGGRNNIDKLANELLDVCNGYEDKLTTNQIMKAITRVLMFLMDIWVE